MSSEHEHGIVAAASALRGSINAMKPSPAKTALRTTSERLVAALAKAGYDLRTGYSMPAILD
jgi:hypothetical protein